MVIDVTKRRRERGVEKDRGREGRKTRRKAGRFERETLISYPPYMPQNLLPRMCPNHWFSPQLFGAWDDASTSQAPQPGQVLYS